MFSSLPNRRFPTSLAECNRDNPIALSLLQWARVVERIGLIVAAILIVSGGISGVICYFSGSGGDPDWVIPCFFGIPTGAVVVALMEYSIHHGIALLVGALANLVQSTSVSADMSLYTAGKAYPEEIPASSSFAFVKEEPPVSKLGAQAAPARPSGWICRCGQSNDDLISFCKSCGKDKVTVTAKSSKPSAPPAHSSIFKKLAGSASPAPSKASAPVKHDPPPGIAEEQKGAATGQSKPTWVCTCGHENTTVFCEGCGKSKY